MTVDAVLHSLSDELTTNLLAYRSRLDKLEVAEKADRTLLTEADLAVEDLIIGRIRRFDPDARVIAEESGNKAWRPTPNAPVDRIWVVDPIDGTAEFVRPERTEYCSVVCVLEQGEPVAALIVAPELGTNRTPVVVQASRLTGEISVNDENAAPNQSSGAASVTRSSGSAARPFESTMVASGYTLKTGTTSTTLDMLRTALDLTGVATDSPRFEVFFAAQQKIWDGVAGLCVGAMVGAESRDLAGRPRTPVTDEILAQPEPTFESTVLGRPDVVEWFLSIAN